MKIIVFVMAFLVLALGAIPCADPGNVANDVAAKKGFVKTDGHKEDPHQDNCSPFCQCACCAGFFIHHFIGSAVVFTLHQKKARPAHLPADVVHIALPIWQPPQLG